MSKPNAPRQRIPQAFQDTALTQALAAPKHALFIHPSLPNLPTQAFPNPTPPANASPPSVLGYGFNPSARRPQIPPYSYTHLCSIYLLWHSQPNPPLCAFALKSRRIPRHSQTQCAPLIPPFAPTPPCVETRRLPRHPQTQCAPLIPPFAPTPPCVKTHRLQTPPCALAALKPALAKQPLTYPNIYPILDCKGRRLTRLRPADMNDDDADDVAMLR